MGGEQLFGREQQKRDPEAVMVHTDGRVCKDAFSLLKVAMAAVAAAAAVAPVGTARQSTKSSGGNRDGDGNGEGNGRQR